MSAAPYPSDARAKGARFPIDVERLKGSDTWTLAPSAVRSWLLMLYTSSWTNVPLGSYENDDEMIAAQIGMDLPVFLDNRSHLMRGWRLCDDGRLYHDYITTLVKELLHERSRYGYRKFLGVVLERCGAKCWYCGCEGISFELDHVMPRSRGGSDTPDNLVPACKPCNVRKGARTPEEWLDA